MTSIGGFCKMRDPSQPVAPVRGANVRFRSQPMSSLGSKLKRILDVVSAGAGLVLLCPVLALVALSIRARMGRPVFFRQKRAGYRGKAFTVFKFRTMIDGCDPEG